MLQSCLFSSALFRSTEPILLLVSLYLALNQVGVTWKARDIPFPFQTLTLMSCFSMTVKQHPAHYEAPAATETHNESFLSNFIFNTPALCKGFVQKKKNVGQKSATWEFQRASLATRPQMHSHTHTHHTPVQTPRLTSSLQLTHISWGLAHWPVCSPGRWLLGTQSIYTQV